MLQTLSNAWFSLPDYGRSTVWTLVITVVLILSVAFLTLVDLPMYQIDALVRRAPSLQKTREGRTPAATY